MEDECFDLSGKSDFTLYCYNIAPFHKSTRRDSERRDAVLCRSVAARCSAAAPIKDLLPHRELLPGKAEEEGPQARRQEIPENGHPVARAGWIQAGFEQDRQRVLQGHGLLGNDLPSPVRVLVEEHLHRLVGEVVRVVLLIEAGRYPLPAGIG